MADTAPEIAVNPSCLSTLANTLYQKGMPNVCPQPNGQKWSYLSVYRSGQIYRNARTQENFGERLEAQPLNSPSARLCTELPSSCQGSTFDSGSALGSRRGGRETDDDRHAERSDWLPRCSFRHVHSNLHAKRGRLDSSFFTRLYTPPVARFRHSADHTNDQSSQKSRTVLSPSGFQLSVDASSRTRYPIEMP